MSGSHIHDMQALLERGGGYRLPQPLGDYINGGQDGFHQFREDLMASLGPRILSMRQREALFAWVYKRNPLSLYEIYQAYAAQVRLFESIQAAGFSEKENIMATPRYVLLDCDDILVDYAGMRSGGMRRHLREVRGIIADPRGPCDWNMSKWMGVDKKTMLEIITEFNERSPAFAELEPIEGAVEGIAALRSEGYLPVVVTSSSTAPHAVQRRHDNLRAVFGEGAFHAIHCVPVGESKESYLKMYPASPWVEDNYENALIGRQCGHAPVVRRTRQNAKFEAIAPEDVPFVDGWDDILAHVRDYHRDLAPAMVM